MQATHRYQPNIRQYHVLWNNHSVPDSEVSTEPIKQQPSFGMVASLHESVVKGATAQNGSLAPSIHGQIKKPKVSESPTGSWGEI